LKQENIKNGTGYGTIRPDGLDYWSKTDSFRHRSRELASHWEKFAVCEFVRVDKIDRTYRCDAKKGLQSAGLC
jgi:hypothetical protein